MANGTLKVSNIQTSSGTGTITLGQSGETIIFGSGVTTKFNQPAFQAKFGDSTTQSLSSSVDTKVQFNEEVFDTDNTYDNTTNYRFTPAVSGKYFIYASVRNTTATDLDVYRISIRKNGTQIQTYMDVTRRQESVSISAIVDSNTTDYFEIFCVINGAVSLGNENGNNGDANYFGAYRLGVE